MYDREPRTLRWVFTLEAATALCGAIVHSLTQAQHPRTLCVVNDVVSLMLGLEETLLMDFGVPPADEPTSVPNYMTSVHALTSTYMAPCWARAPWPS